MSDIVKAFNDHFEEFVADVQKVFPNDKDIIRAQTGLSLIRMSNPKMIITSFNDYVAKPYRNEILRGDLTFFIEKDYSKEVDKTNGILEKIESLRNPVRNMKKNDQDKVMKYLQNLTKLCDLYN